MVKIASVLVDGIGTACVQNPAYLICLSHSLAVPLGTATSGRATVRLDVLACNNPMCPHWYICHSYLSFRGGEGGMLNYIVILTASVMWMCKCMHVQMCVSSVSWAPIAQIIVTSPSKALPFG